SFRIPLRIDGLRDPPCVRAKRAQAGRGLRMQAGPADHSSQMLRKNQERESSDSPMLNAFWRVAPSVIFNFLAIFDAAVFFLACDFNSLIAVAVQSRRFFDFLAINPPFQERQTISLSGGERNTIHRAMSQDRAMLHIPTSHVSMSHVRSFVRE